MVVAISPGTALVALSNASGQTVLCTWDATENTPPLANAPASGSRIDLIVLQVRDQVLDGTGAGGNNDFIFQSVTGTPSTGVPVVPPTPTNAIALAQVTIPANVPNLNGVSFVDVRPMGGPLALAGPKWPAVPFVSGFQSRTDNDGVVWVAKGGVNGGAWRQARDVVHASWGRGAAYTIVSTINSVPWDVLANDPYGMWTAGLVGFTVPVTGQYQVSYTLQVAMNAVQFGYCQLYNNGTLVRTTSLLSGSTTNYYTLSITTVIGCNAGWLVQTAANVIGGRGDIQAGAWVNWANVDYLSP